MYSTLATIDADELYDSQYLFGGSHHLLPIPMSHDSPNEKRQPSPTAPISALNNLHYSESTPSSVHYGENHDMSELSTSHMSGRDERDGSTSSGYVNGQEGSHGSASMQYSHPLRTSNTTEKYDPDFNQSNGSNPLLNGSTSTNPTSAQSRTIASRQFSVAQDSRYPISSSKASSTPEGRHQSQEQSSTPRSRLSSPAKGKPAEMRANSSIPADVSWEEFGRQCILAAESSRLNPFALHPDEYKLLRHHVTHAQVTIYINIRNAILRLWMRNPLVYVSVEEAAGCARDKRYFNLAKVARLWLMRNGYINFGCVETPNTATTIPYTKVKRGVRRTVIVVGAGMSGLGCARHLEGLCAQLGSSWVDEGERPPKVIVLEARPRIGGRVYSHPFQDQTGSTLPPGYLCTAEMGAQIVTGYEHGNPMNALIRGQLGIPYHGLRDNTILYDYDGTVVERSQDTLVEKLYNDVLERASVYRKKPAIFRTVEGDRNLILFGREPSDAGGATIAELEQSNNPLPTNATTTASTLEEKPSSGVEKRAGRTYQLSAGFNPNISVTQAARDMGWHVKDGAPTLHTLDMDVAAKASKHPTLGRIMDEGIKQYQKIVDMKPRDLRLLNWHHANLEYANAVSVNQLSLSGWDQDIGNEFEGQHTEIIGGYQQVPRGLWQCPTKLDVRFQSVLKTVHYNTEEQEIGKAVKVECTNGEVFEADRVVLTTPLGVLKSGSVDFQPPLPDWKQDVIERMGFGLLNKVVLVYEKAFWEPHRDMFGLLNEAEHQASINPEDYSSRRGRYYLFWNCIKTSGKPTLIALMAGEAAHYAEITSNDQLVKEVTDRLDQMFAPNEVPLPTETMVTRWSKDPFARGSYSYVGPRTQAGDYDVMARPHGPVHFAGEATCGTHPATVHGAYLSGLRAAAEVVESMIGPIKVPTPLIEKKVKHEQAASYSVPEPKRRAEAEAAQESKSIRMMRDEEYEASIIGEILEKLGERPIKPGRAGVNPFLLYTKDYWYICKKECDDKRKAATGDPNAKASKTEIRTALGLKWRTEDAEIRKPYLDQTQSAKDDAAANAAGFEERVSSWDKSAAHIRREYIQANPPPNGDGDLLNSRTAIELGAGKRLRRL
ncbi:lysine-specific histone demethylase 1 [Massarina eburnea CBS 473.64]|uniref:Lysine-specific histone demethylase 1 n=1 Tax=Massarina eburnea CBS 473.64 TaxID=1395130 RepID=A0A6A6RNF7_9PLEO|nr:lysine-specific histone demethylase 1 [Massarina eburnea CBS 473.64]